MIHIMYIFNSEIYFLSEHTTLVCGYHVLDVDVGILASILLQDLKSFLHQISKVLFLLLCVVYFVADVHYHLYNGIYVSSPWTCSWRAEFIYSRELGLHRSFHQIALTSESSWGWHTSQRDSWWLEPLWYALIWMLYSWQEWWVRAARPISCYLHDLVAHHNPSWLGTCMVPLALSVPQRRLVSRDDSQAVRVPTSK